MRREARKLPPLLRQQFDTGAGQDELRRAMTDKRLLIEEARRRGLAEKPEIREQVLALEERLIVQALLSDEEKARPYGDKELRAFFDEHKERFRQPERVRVARLLARTPKGASAAEKARAKARAKDLARRLARGEPLAALAKESDGPERVRDGDLGLLAPGDLTDKAVERAAFRLAEPGEVSEVFECEGGFAVLRLLERRPARLPSFDEVRGDVETRFLAHHKRRVFNDVIAHLRAQAETAVVEGQHIQ